MDVRQKSPSPQMWLDDFKAMLALSPLTVATVRKLIHSRYPDSGFAEEYGQTIWSARLYLVANQCAWEAEGLVVLGSQKSLLKDCLLVALYEPFLSAPWEQLTKREFDTKAIAESARKIEARFPAK